jgi:hypothetical protein
MSRQMYSSFSSSSDSQSCPYDVLNVIVKMNWVLLDEEKRNWAKHEWQRPLKKLEENISRCHNSFLSKTSGFHITRCHSPSKTSLSAPPSSMKSLTSQNCQNLISWLMLDDNFLNYFNPISRYSLLVANRLFVTLS